jgi:hypothetical protein
LVRGDATDEEIAALLAVILATGSGAEPDSTPAVASAWTDRAALMRRAPGTVPAPGRGAWRSSAWPR